MKGRKLKPGADSDSSERDEGAVKVNVLSTRVLLSVRRPHRADSKEAAVDRDRAAGESVGRAIEPENGSDRAPVDRPGVASSSALSGRP